MGKAKRHLRGMGVELRAACGLLNPRHYTTDPAEVSCLACSKTLLMADTEVRLSLGTTRVSSH